MTTSFITREAVARLAFMSGDNSPEAIALRRRQSRIDSQAPHLAAAIKLLKALRTACRALADLRALDPSLCPLGAFEALDPESLWAETLPGLAWSLDAVHGEVATQLTTCAAGIAEEELPFGWRWVPLAGSGDEEDPEACDDDEGSPGDE